PQRTGRHRLAGPDQGALRNPRHQRTADDRPRRIERLHPPGELGRASSVADHEARVQGGVPSLMVKWIGTAIVTAILVSAFWIFYFNIREAPTGVTLAGQKDVINPDSGPRVAVAEGVTVGPAGLAIPVVGIQASELLDTFSQARAGGARRHDAIDIMAP